jgi:hypothetical protein
LRLLGGWTNTAVKKARNSSTLIPRASCPRYAYDIDPVSSETTTTAASVSSDNPIAARWRVPKLGKRFSCRESGKMQAA